ncbi:hypothetical protein HpBT107_02820 [Helicobacter pylori]
MFATDVVIIFIIFFGVSFILFGKEKNIKKDSKILDAIMNIIFVIIVVCIFFPWLPMLLFYIFGLLALHVIPYQKLLYYSFNQSHIHKLTM